MIDWNRVSELRDEVGPDDFGEVVELFLEEVECEMGPLRNSLDQQALEARLHFLKGSALNLGFSEFSERCQVGDTAAAKGRQSEVDIDAIRSCYDASKSEFLGGLSKLPC